jgi:anti-sigma factor RsiW
MKVTREVIYDLLPSYFAGDASDDTRALVEAYFESDPEFGRMATRFQSLLAERQRTAPAAADRERETFACARQAAELPRRPGHRARSIRVAALFAVAFMTRNARMGRSTPGILLECSSG